MNPIISTLIMLVLKLLEPFLKSVIDLAYREIEEWARKKEKDTGKKPTSEEKMKAAVMVVKAKAPNVDEQTARVLLQARHRREMAKREGGRKPT